MSQESSCMALFSCRKIQEKFRGFMRYSGAGSSPRGPEGVDYRIGGKELEFIIGDYAKKLTLVEIAAKTKRSPHSIRRVLRKAGVYEVERESAKTKLNGYTATKTIRID